MFAIDQFEDLQTQFNAHVEDCSHLSNKLESTQIDDARLANINETAAGSETVLDGHVSSMEGITTDAKRKWQEFSLQAENDAKENADFSAAKHCRFELLMQKRGASQSNEHHAAETGSARKTAKEDVSKNSEDIIKHMEEEQEVVRGILDTIKAQSMIIETLQEDHSTQYGAIEQKARDTFQQKYMDCEPSGNTLVRCDTDVPSKVAIESLCALP
ncbi:kinesin motor domain-containing protein [Artemisia annua]|uniref:Kinesin motor domain-containing protein n=1 Tax=Artemisia annua TaxID=35608 RepID=A0A2U1L4G9_ARTAN|nr:kinesin motor domain-containing protein [Artemisia annua]